MAADGTSRAPSRWLVTDARRRSTLLYLARRLANSTRRDNGKRMIQTTTLPTRRARLPGAGPRSYAARSSAAVRRDGGPVSDHQQPASLFPPLDFIFRSHE